MMVLMMMVMVLMMWTMMIRIPSNTHLGPLRGAAGVEPVVRAAPANGSHCCAIWAALGSSDGFGGMHRGGAVPWQAVVARLGYGKYTSGRDRLRRFP
eukprot:3326810-Pyramimonas_sp.AAC.1